MAAHLNLNTTFGVTLPSGAIAESAERMQTVEAIEVTGTSGEIVKALPAKTFKSDVTISGKGPAGLDLVTTGTISDPSTMTITSAESGETNKATSTFTIKASAHEAFTDGEGSGSAGDEPDIDTVEIVSVTYAVVESVKRTRDVKDMVLIGSDGTPAARGKVTRTGTFDIIGRGDIPGGIALGTAGAALASFTGVVLATSLKESEKAGDWNGWGISGKHYPAAS